MNKRPGRAVGDLGTWAAVLGVIVIAETFVLRRYGVVGADGLFVGGSMLVGGLLLRIEAAVTRSAGRICGMQHSSEVQQRGRPETASSDP